jgi:hypothetical protein
MHRSKNSNEKDNKKLYKWKNKHDHKRWLDQTKTVATMPELLRPHNAKMILIKSIEENDENYNNMMKYCEEMRALEKKSKKENKDSWYQGETPDIQHIEGVLRHSKEK